MGSNKPSVYKRPDPNIEFVDGNIYDPRPEPLNNDVSDTSSNNNNGGNNDNNNSPQPIVNSDLSIPTLGMTSYSTLV
jgi:hypothetical protein